MRETHAAVVFLVGDLAYKMKKSVSFGFLDFRSREERRRICEQEVRLNRRLAPDVYLGVCDVSDAHGVPCEHLVVMRRMPENRRLSTLVRSGSIVENELRAVAPAIADFHTRCEGGADVVRHASRDSVRGRWLANLEGIRACADVLLDWTVLDEIDGLANRYLAGREELFAARMRAGFIVDGHGDLLADDIFCLPEGPRILDCLEFDDTLRAVDRLDDAGFLALDLERLGRPDLAQRYLRWYLEFSGQTAPASLLHHYLAYRAVVRAKVACLRYTQGDASAAAEARVRVRIAHRHLSESRVRLILVGGLPGTGKSTLAGALSERFGPVVLGSDAIRKELAGLPADHRQPAPYRQGIYTPAWTARTYTEMLARAERLLAPGESVVLDASWTDTTWRAQAAEVAARAHSTLVPVRCEVATETAAARVNARLRAHRGVSDADAQIAAAMRADADAWPEAAVVDTTPRPRRRSRGQHGSCCPRPCRQMSMSGARRWLPTDHGQRVCSRVRGWTACLRQPLQRPQRNRADQEPDAWSVRAV